MIIDFRSDTFTKPTAAMLNAMFNAEVGDDVFCEDPTVNRLEELAAVKFGMEAALYCPSGTMSNQIGIKCHTQPGNEVICEKLSHVYIYEGGGIAFNSGCQVHAIDGIRGQITAEQIKAAINPDDVHKPKTSLVSLENTGNRGGGSCYEMSEILKIRALCNENDIKLHLDGARLWNALVAKGESPLQYGKIFDSISVCLSKGLGAPIGSILLGKKEFIKQARRIRKVFGGGMRQAGYIAAAGIFALENNIERLAEDHKHAKLLAEEFYKKDFIGNIMPVETNIIILEVKEKYNAASLQAKLKENNILCLPISETKIRLITHLDISPEMIDKTIEVIRKL
ncbi:MAG: aminotransferase class I/II-fold pyridoxal phosphate-dependent enzyme [Bacteroidia bacterium]|nr:aminotransferase class I/II-fold pyridoxal phosphate-dependent enzyme [Bacteroidia bacterium]